MMKPGVAMSLAWLALAGCAHVGGRAHAGRDATADGAKRLVIDGAESSTGKRVKDVVTARGGDPIDWYVFEVERPCDSIALSLDTEPARPGMALAIKLVKPNGTLLATRAGKKRHDTIAIRNAALGHYYVGVQTLGDAAAKYRLVARDARTGFECGDLPPPRPFMFLRPPASVSLPPAPPGTIVAPVSEWLGYSNDGQHVSYVADIAAGFGDGVGHATASVLDDHGQPLPGIKVSVQAYELHRASGVLIGDSSIATKSWAVAIEPTSLPAPPLTAKVIDRWTRDGAVFVAFDRGSSDGIAVGWRGSYRGGRTVEVVEVQGIRGVARLDGTSLDAVLDLAELRLAPRS
jgi:hypothetical protein